MQIRFLVVACVALGIIGCDQRLPVAPSPESTGTSTPTAVSSSPYVVRDDRGHPIAKATISFWPEARATQSNEAGQFQLPDPYIEVVYASKAGYENDHKYVDRSVELTLHDIIRFSPGQSVRLTIGPNDQPGGMPLEPYRTRVVRLAANETGTVRIHVTAEDNGPAEYWIQNYCGDVCPIRSAPSTFSVRAGEEYPLWIRTANASVARTFTVETWREGL